MLGIDGECFLAQNVLVVRESQHTILEVVGMRSGHIDDVNILVFDELLIRSIGVAGEIFLLWGDDFRDEFLGRLGGR